MTKLEEIIEEADEHNILCGGQILSSDDPVNGKIGWACVVCHMRFEMLIQDIKRDKDKIPPELLKLLLTDEGRVKFAKRLGFQLFIWEEQLC